ncbi:Hsp20/alpha crystallin family protein [Oscillatoria sp. CS-180]|uniref:Hsp20/alpha crystallin family protein n=1 Tax=Oscillatoria sp. CS-180 TaxID=3021720 RepID=UPI00232FDB5D|nr:Hsp20/alpha crystallin family protein [Oscillatoria sp. CS-180]MDB9525837.1 Hsp20/alpha crystallin family protein [Oscillatoria sp. CS-180]
MAIVRWDPFREVMAIQREMNRLFDDLAMNGEGQEAGSRRTMGFLPPAEMEESDSKIQLRLEVPGMSAEDLDIRVMKEAVVVSGERKTESTSEKNGQKRSEFRYGSFSRTIPFPVPVDNSTVQADYKDGILKLELSKMEDNSNKAVKVSLAGSNSDNEPQS